VSRQCSKVGEKVQTKKWRNSPSKTADCVRGAAKFGALRSIQIYQISFLSDFFREKRLYRLVLTLPHELGITFAIGEG
jgi:hypothetical protein